MPSPTRHRPASRLSAGLLVLVAPLAAQAPSPWVDLHVPAGVPAGTVQAEGKLVVYRNGTTLRVFSAVTNRWHALAVSAGTSYVLKKDVLLVPESDRWTAFSAWSGTFATLFVPYASSTILHDDSVACVREGASVHAYSAFTGQWYTRPMPAGWLLQVSNRVALVHTPFTAGNLAASVFDALGGQWLDVPAQPLPPFGAQVTGGTAVVTTAAMQFGFSGLRPGWVQAPASLPSPFPQFQDFYFEREQTRGLGTVFSGITGTFAAMPVTGTAVVVDLSQNLATAMAGTNRWVSGAGQNVWVPMPAAPYLTPGTNVPLGWGSGQLHAFSPHLGVWATVNWASMSGLSTMGSKRNVAGMFDASTGNRGVFSAFTGQWHTPPAGTLAESPWLADNGALCRTTTGVVAFAARSGGFFPLPGATSRYNGFTAGAATTLSVFDAHGERWLTLPRQPGPGYGPLFGSRTMLATDGLSAFGFSPRGGRFAAVALPEPVADVQARDDVGFVRTAAHLLAFSGLGDTATWQDAPDGIYGVGLGAIATVQARVPAGHFVALGFGPPAAAPVATPFGELWLDPAGAIALGLVAAPGTARAVVPIAIPNTLALRGSRWLQQAITLTPAGTIHLGDPSSLLVQ